MADGRAEWLADVRSSGLILSSSHRIFILTDDAMEAGRTKALKQGRVGRGCAGANALGVAIFKRASRLDAGMAGFYFSLSCINHCSRIHNVTFQGRRPPPFYAVVLPVSLFESAVASASFQTPDFRQSAPSTG